MLFVSINHLQVGDIVAKDVVNEKGALLIKKGHPLSDYVLKKIKELTLPGLYIRSSLSDDIQIEDLISPEVKDKSIKSFQNMNYDKSNMAAKAIVQDVIRKNDLTLNYMDYRYSENYLAQHSTAVAEIAVVIGKSLGYNESQLTELATAALLHDIGKIYEKQDKNTIKKEQTKEKASKYNEYSYELHPWFGVNVLNDLPISYTKEITSTIKHAILFHHINEDPKIGAYPEFISLPKEIHEFCKIIHIADAYDNMRYSNEISNPTIAYEYIRDNCGTLFNTEIVNKFIAYAPPFPVGTKVYLNKGLTGIVIKSNKNFPTRPTIRIIDDKQFNGQLVGVIIDLEVTNYLIIIGTEFTNNINIENEIVKSNIKG